MPSLSEIKLIVGGVFLLAIAITIGLLDDRLRHYKKLYQQDEKTIVVLNTQIQNMTTKQNEQIKTTQSNVDKVVAGPETVKTVIKEIHDAPITKDCKTPTLSQETLNAF